MFCFKFTLPIRPNLSTIWAQFEPNQPTKKNTLKIKMAWAGNGIFVYEWNREKIEFTFRESYGKLWIINHIKIIIPPNAIKWVSNVYVFFRGVSVNITTIHIIAYYERILNYVLWVKKQSTFITWFYSVLQVFLRTTTTIIVVVVDNNY